MTAAMYQPVTMHHERPDGETTTTEHDHPRAASRCVALWLRQSAYHASVEALKNAQQMEKGNRVRVMGHTFWIEPRNV